MVGAAGRLAHLRHGGGEGEAARMLRLRGLLERIDKQSCRRLRNKEEKHVVQAPVVIGVRSYVGRLIRIGAQVEYLGHAKRREGMRPKPQSALGSLFHEDIFQLS